MEKTHLYRWVSAMGQADELEAGGVYGYGCVIMRRRDCGWADRQDGAYGLE